VSPRSLFEVVIEMSDPLEDCCSTCIRIRLKHHCFEGLPSLESLVLREVKMPVLYFLSKGNAHCSKEEKKRAVYMPSKAERLRPI